MRHVLQTIVIKCDHCEETVHVLVKDSADAKLPSGWTVQEIHNCGLTDYTRRVELCKACTENFTDF